MILASAAALLAAEGAAMGAGGQVVWSQPFSAPDVGASPQTGPDGSLYWAAGGLLHKDERRGHRLGPRHGPATRIPG
jgi:hypothetical protein